jgi:hypothetical protein
MMGALGVQVRRPGAHGLCYKAGMAFELLKVVTRDGQEHGPVAPDALRGWVAAGHVPVDAVAVCQATGARKAVGEVLGLPPPAAFPPPGAYPPAAGYGYPPGYPPPQPQGFQPVDLIAPVNVRNALAVAAGYLGIFSFFCFGPLLGIPAIICGALALKKKEQLGGAGRAWTGIICGGLSTLIYGLAFLIPMLAKG